MNEQGLETIVGGIRCRDVLAELSDYLDGALAPRRVAELQGHLAGCPNCARFGGHIARTLTMLQAACTAPAGDVAERVMAKIRAGA